MMCKKFITVGLMFALFTAVFSSSAATIYAAITYPDVMGDTVWFRGIVEDADPDSLLPLYGQPVAQGDSLNFPVTGVGNFSTTSVNGAGVASVDGTLSLMILAKPGYFIENLSFLESGLATLFKPPGSDDDPFAAVTGLFEIGIVEVDGAPIVPINLPGLSMDYTPSNGDFQYSVDNDVPGVDNSPGLIFSAGWEGSLGVNLTDQLIEHEVDFWEGVTKLNITLDNKLLAFTGLLGSEAFIDKKNFDIFVETVPKNFNVPEPTTLVLALFGLAAGAVGGKKTRVSRPC